MGIKHVTPEANGAEPTAPPGLPIDPNFIIDSLINRVQQLTLENAMLQAALAQYQAQEANNEAHHPQ